MLSLLHLFRHLLGLGGRRVDTPEANRPERDRTQAEEFEEVVHRGGATRITTVRTMGGPVTDGGTTFRQEHIEYEDDDGTARRLVWFDTATCAFHHVLDQNCHAVSTCSVCGQVMCSTPGCAGACVVCGQACCAEHRKTYGLGDGKTVTYCVRCRNVRWWRVWWGIEE